MKIIHCGDIHLESPMNTRFTEKMAGERRRELIAGFKEMVRYAVVNGVEAIIIAGDLFDKGKVSKKTSDIILRMIEENRGIDFYYLRGNHDRGRWVESLGHVPDNLLLFDEEYVSYIANDKRKGNIVITGIEKKGTDTSLYDELELGRGDFNIVVMHGNLVDSNAVYNEEDISLRRLAGKNIDYLALGHIHTYSEGKIDPRGTFCYSGCLMGRGFDECGEHGFILLDIDENRLSLNRRFVKMSGRGIYRENVDITGCRNNNDIVMSVLSYLNSKNILSESIVRVILCGKTVSECEIDVPLLSRLLEEEYYYIEVVNEIKLKTAYEMKSTTLKGEFIRLVNEKEKISDDDKQAIIRYGLMALSGENFQYED